MTKRKSLLASFAFALAFSLALLFGITLSGGGLTAYAEDNSSDGKTIIQLVEATVTVPVAGETIDTTPTVNGNLYKVNKAEWYKGADVVAENKMNQFSKFAEGQQYTVAVKFNVTGTGSYRFDSEETLAKINGQPATTFSVFDSFISAKYTFSVESTPVPEYSVTLENGTLEDGNRSGTFEAGETVKIIADDAPEGKVFYEWVVVSGNVSIGTDYLAKTTFEMEDEDVVIKADYRTVVPFVDLTLKIPLAGETVGGNALSYATDKGYTATLIWEDENGTELPEGTTFQSGVKYWITIEVSVSDKSEYIFTGNTLAALNEIGQSLMDQFDFEFTIEDCFVASTSAPEYYDIKIIGGRAEIGNVPAKKSTEGLFVDIIADEAPAGKEFDKWVVVSGDVTFDEGDEYLEESCFEMPAGNVEIKAVYKEIPHEHNFGGWIEEVAATTENEGVKAHKDCTICLKHFDKDGNEIEDITIERLPKEDEKESKPEKETESEKESTGASDKETASDKESVSDKETASDKESAGSGTGTEIKPADSKPTENEGLSGGAIAGIVGGSVVAAGLGGFSVFWFVVKKKSFADLIAIFKK